MLEHERASSAPGQDLEVIDRTADEPQGSKTQAERKQDADIASGEEQLG